MIYTFYTLTTIAANNNPVFGGIDPGAVPVVRLEAESIEKAVFLYMGWVNKNTPFIVSDPEKGKIQKTFSGRELLPHYIFNCQECDSTGEPFRKINLLTEIMEG